MIVKEIAHTMRWNKERKIRNLIHYILDESKTLKDPEGRQVIIKRFLSGFDPEGWVQQFVSNDQPNFNHINRSVIRHTILSFAPTSTPFLSPTVLTDIAQNYLSKRSKSPAIGVIHTEMGKPTHIHLLIASTNIDHSSSRINHQAFRTLKIEMEAYIEKEFPDIHRTSYVAHERSRDKPP